MSTNGVCQNQHPLYFVGMNLGGRIKKRLAELGWRQADLLTAVPDLTAARLPALIKRDSIRCELDHEIANALGVTLEWLNTGIAPPEQKPADGGITRIPLEQGRRRSPEIDKIIILPT